MKSTLDMEKEVRALQAMNVDALRERYAEVFGEPTSAGNKVWLVRRIAWRLQSQVEGDLSERARRRAEELANENDLRVIPPKPPRQSASELAATKVTTSHVSVDSRLPPPGSVLKRNYKGRVIEVLVRKDGFLFEGEVYKSLTSAALAVTGAHCNGFAFFGLSKKGDHQ